MKTTIEKVTHGAETVAFQVEDYRNSGTEAGGSLEQQEMRRLYAAAGFARLAGTEDAPMGQRLSRDEIVVWEWRYPTVYQTTGRSSLRAGSAQQAFKLWADLPRPVPVHVLGMIPEARPLFDALEVWTPDLFRVPRQLALSPILVGWRGQNAYLLARWAEALEPFEDIRTRALSLRGRLATYHRNTFMGAESVVSTPSAVVGGVAAFSIIPLACELAKHPDNGLFFAVMGAASISLAGIATSAWFKRGGPVFRRAARWAGWDVG